MTDSRFRGWIYWVCLVVCCGLTLFAGIVFRDINSIIALMILAVIFAIIYRVEQHNLLTYLRWYHRGPLDAIKDNWYFRDAELNAFIFSDKLDDDPEVKGHKRNNRHIRIVLAVIVTVNIVSEIICAFIVLSQR